MPPYLHLSVLWPYMPASVLEEIREKGDPDLVGWSPLLKHWLSTSEHWRVVRWRRDLREYTRKRYRRALNRQVAVTDAYKAFYPKGRTSIRHIAGIDPVLRDYNEDVFKGREGLAVTRRDEPKLFIN